MKIYKSRSVYEEALDRIRWLYDEFPNIVCTVSGGKDSTVIFHLSLQVAREKGRLPLKVMFLDQEAEWASTIEQIEEIMHHPDVEPYWYQIPLRLFNATSSSEHWLNCWDPAREEDWIHPQDPISIKENRYGTDRFSELFDAIIATEYADSKTCCISGVRTEESPSRFMGLTYWPTYKWATWGSVLTKKLQHYTMYPIYDWSYTDVWKAIHDNEWSYNKLYDLQYQWGRAPKDMRVSNVHHETAIHDLFFLQEVEPDTYVKLTKRIAGIDMTAKMGKADYMPKELPFMFESWREYRDYLLDKLVDNEDWKRRFRVWFDRHDADLGEDIGDRKYRAHVKAILVNDWEGVTLSNFLRSPQQANVRARRRKEAADAVQ